MNVPIGLSAIAVTLARLGESFGPKARVDFLGLVLITCGAFSLVWGLVRANAAGWGSLEVVGSLAAGLTLLVLFVMQELRSSAPMMPMRLFAQRAFAAGNASMLCLYGALMATIFFLAQFQEVVLGQGPLVAGLRLLPWGIAIVAVAPRAGALAERFGESSVVIIGLLVQAVGLAWIALLAQPGVAYAQMILPMLAAGAGFAMAIPIVQKSVVNSVSPADIGKASGALSMIRQLGGALGVAVAVTVFAESGNRATPQAFSVGFSAAMGVAALLSIAGAIAGFWLPAQKQGARTAPGLAPEPILKDRQISDRAGD